VAGQGGHDVRVADGEGEVGVGVELLRQLIFERLIDPSNKHRINGRVAIFLKEGAFEGVRIQFVQEAIR